MVSFGKCISAKGQPQVVLHMMSHLGLGLIIRIGLKVIESHGSSWHSGGRERCIREKEQKH